MKYICKNYERSSHLTDRKCPVECTATSCKEFDPTDELWNWFIEHCDQQGECGKRYLEDYEPQRDESRD